MFPMSLDGEFKLTSPELEDISAILSKVEQALRAARATNISRIGNRVVFQGGIFRLVMNWNILVPVGRGEIEIVPGKPGTVKYGFSCVQMLILLTLMVGAMSVALISREGLSAHAIIFLVIGWLWLFGMNYVISAVRLPRFVRRAVGV